MSYEPRYGHTPDDCDKCGQKVGYANLTRAPFLYLDQNDKSHPDLGGGYRQYRLCTKCYAKETERPRRKHR